MAEVLRVEKRSEIGKHRTRRLRRAGRVPAVLYGHGQESMSLTLSAEEIGAALRHGSRVVELAGGVNENALIRALQWDPFGTEVLHVDLMRVSIDERIEVSVTVELRGVAPGQKEGGVVQVHVHEVAIETTAAAIPEKLHINVNDLRVGQSKTAADIEDLPSHAKLLIDPETVVVHCFVPVEREEAEAVGESVEPELIGRKEDKEQEEED